MFRGRFSAGTVQSVAWRRSHASSNYSSLLMNLIHLYTIQLVITLQCYCSLYTYTFSIDFQAVICIYLLCFFSVTKHQIVKVATVVNLVYIYLTRMQFEYPVEIGPGGAIYLPYLVLQNTAWSPKKGTLYIQGLGNQYTIQYIAIYTLYC